MQCHEVKEILKEVGFDGQLSDWPGLMEHLEECTACRNDCWEMCHLRWHLSELPAPELREGFLNEAIDRAWETREGRKVSRRAGSLSRVAIAASVVLAVVITATAPWWSPEQTVMTSSVQVAPHRVSQIDLMMTSQRALPDAVITVEVDEGIALQGYPAVHRLRWQAPIVAGENRLSLPVQLQGGERGVIVVGIESGGLRKEMTLAVEADDDYMPVTRSI
ncbi:MAG: hypothetical protein HUJ31_19120 [Pseudomonadales bacterium]|nr:hypothetical protein [Pseudomonadales bacterium]